jgi:nucleoside triphosphate pyrophosphatase
VIREGLALVEPLVLASRSPQRRAILTQLGVRFEVVEPAYDEVDPPGAAPEQLVVEHARGKARSVDGEGRWVLGVGREHVVHSGLCLRGGATEIVRLASTRVRFRNIEQSDLDWYLASAEWRERAGGYAVQGRGAAFVEGIDGDHSNVVGLPVTALVEALARAREAAG